MALLDWFCNENAQFFQSNTLNSTTIPLVDSCIQHTLAIYIPCLFFLIFCPVLLYDLYWSRNGTLKCQSPTTYRMLLSSILILIVGVMLLNAIHDRYRREDQLYRPLGQHLFALTLLNLCIGISLMFMIACRNRGIVSSGVLFNFHLLLVVCGFPELINCIHNLNVGVQSKVHCLLFLIYYSIILLILLLSCFADQIKYRKMKKDSCPEFYSSFLNRITFHWFTGLTIKGYFKGLTIADLWNLGEQNQTAYFINEFNRNYERGVQNLAKQKKIQLEKLFKQNGLPMNGAAETERLKENAEKTFQDIHPFVVLPLACTFPSTLLGGAFCKLVYDILQFGFPELLKLLINFIEDGTQPTWLGVTIAIAMFALTLVNSLILHQYFHAMFRVGMNVRSVLSAAVYKKAINLSNSARKDQTIGSIVNIMAVDLQRFQDLTIYLMLMWSAPFQMLLALYFLWKLLGFCVLSGVVILIVLVPLNSLISSRTQKCQAELIECKDRRLRLISEVMNGIKMVKLFGWESFMQQKILEERRKEVNVLKRLAFWNAATSLSWSCAPFLVAATTFGTYVLIDPKNNILTPQIVFVAISLFNILRFPMSISVMVYTQIVQFKVSNQRVKAFLAAEELQPQQNNQIDIANDTAILLRGTSYSWDHDSYPTLNDLNVEIKKGSLTAVIGRIGSGKSSLIQALLGQMYRRDGWSQVDGRIAYVPQQSWIQNMTVRDNILFSQEYKEDVYNKIIERCALKPDVAALAAGDLTEIGEKGINLSGGQKQRISLARAVYSDADIYLLDDTLSAVDNTVSRSIFEGVITGLLAKKTRVFVTHSLVYLKHCDQIIVMKDGRISESGSYQELMQKSGEFATILEEFLMEEARNRGRSISFGEDAIEVQGVLRDLERFYPQKKEEVDREIQKVVDEENENTDDSTPLIQKRQSTQLLQPPTTVKLPTEPIVNGKNQTSNGQNVSKSTTPEVKTTTANNSTPRGRLIEGESVETGQVKPRVYWTYISAIGYPVFILFLVIDLFSCGLGIKSNMWLADWSDEALRELKTVNSTDNLTVTSTTSMYTRLGIYTLLGMGQAVFVCVAAVLVSLGMVRASWILHESMLNGILRSPMAFFDTTPLGRVLNRFSKDIDMVDSRLPGSVLNFLASVIQALAIMFVPAIITPQVTIPLLLITAAYLLLTVFYLSTSRQLKRIEAVTRSPIYSHFAESIQGAASIRAYNCVDRFVLASQERVDQNLRAYYPSIVSNRWLAIRLELIGNLIIFSSALFAVLYRDTGVTAGLIGLSVSYAFNVTTTLNWAVRMSSDLETNIVSVERIQEYAENKTELQINAAPGNVVVDVREEWPPNGEIRFENLSLRYRSDLDDVLHDVNVTIKPCEKIGIVGRTGSGKSSLALALLRIVEPSNGRIVIDQKDIAHVRLDVIRSRVTIVPQDPVLLSGTIRFNLDPCEQFTEDALWDALKLAHMQVFVETLPDQLDHKVSEGGSNLSVGQRQLICLARALLRRPRILVLDEASASVDMETDSIVHNTIQQHFRNCTVLTIAHRLNWMFHCDRILTMENGRVVEFDTPHALWNNEQSTFRALANESDLPLQIPRENLPHVEVTVAEVNSPPTDEEPREDTS
ncbi:ATP-binding cassette sub-family C member 8 [Aphelenchoides besseyi]|nr:ATP-binding cassette sub-family C member 8 [Aphelenchoides besseyi]